MSKKTCFMIFIVALVTIMASYIANFTVVTKEVNAVFVQMQNIYLALSAVILSMLFIKIKHYWLIMLGLSVITACLIQAFLVGGSIITIALIYKIIAFITYVYLITLIRYML